ncbi:MAG: arginine deiminase [Tissierellales bacterium]|nr:arginine deiminase [Tissierellales bacterium]MBN2827327.1 arginine deiminase [Tissierellales bacterium]
MKPINVTSEIGRLKKVLLHRPGQELENLMPEYLERLLFDDIPYLEIAQQEHDAFADVLRKNGTEVVYLEDLAAESLVDCDVKNLMLEDYLHEAGIWNEKRFAGVREYFLELDKRQLIDKMMAGLRKSEFKNFVKRGLRDYLDDDYPFIIDPMPNLYFTRDPFASIGNGLSLHKMKTETRNRETLFTKYIIKYHPDFADHDIPLWYDRNDRVNLEGGDILILNENIIAVGISQRTDPAAIEIFAERILKADNTFNRILAFDIPKSRSFMHLDTVFTMVDHGKFTIHPNIQNTITLYSLTYREGKIEISEEKDTLENILSKYLEIDNVELIKCGGSSRIDAAREQWNDGSNTLAIAPGEVIVYSRNYVTNQLLRDRGIKTHVIPSSELSRGRGGPRCMSMPLIRE